MQIGKLLLGESLIKEGYITKEQLSTALEEQKRTGELLGRILVNLRFVNEEKLARFLSSHLSIEYLSLENVSVSPDLLKIVSAAMAKKYCLIPFKKEGQTLTVVMTNPQNTFVIDELRTQTGLRIETKISTETAINNAIEQFYGVSGDLNEILSSVKKEGEDSDNIRQLKIIAEEAPIVKLVDQLIHDAVKDRASDIHLEPSRKNLFVRYRIDGILHDIATLPKHTQNAIISRVKIISGMDIAERRVPQDGRFRMNIDNNDIDLRVSTFPDIYGEKTVMRLLNRSTINIGLNELGFWSNDLDKFHSLIKRPYGIIFVTGPTGSGKTTTLYSVLKEIKNREKNIMTVEDPVEYELEGINQCNINVKAGLTFANSLRSLMRQDPDVIMIGEIRDFETAEIAIRAALTGHLVLSTLHTNDAPGAITRLVDMGVEPFLVSSSILGVLAQRLIRVICPKCKEEAKVDGAILKEFNLDEKAKFYHGKGCSNCKNIGLLGRTGIFELMVIDEELSSLVTKKVSTLELRKVAKDKGMRSLREDGVQKALAGITTVDEVIRNT